MELKTADRLTWDDLPGIEAPFSACRAVEDDFFAARSFGGIFCIFGMDKAIESYYRLFSPYGPHTGPEHALGWLLEQVGSGQHVLIRDSGGLPPMESVLRWRTADSPRGCRVARPGDKPVDRPEGHWVACADLPMFLRWGINECLSKARRSPRPECREPEREWWNGLLEGRRWRRGRAGEGAAEAPLPMAKGIQTASSAAGISAEEARMLVEKQHMEEEKTGFVAVFVNNNGIGHVSVFVGDSSNKERILYDPCGSYVKKGLNYRVGDILTADEFDYSDYYAYHKMDGDDIRVYPFKVTKKEENEIMERIFDPETTSTCTMQCAVRSREVLYGVGPFKNLKRAFLFSGTAPGSVAEDMEAILKSK